MEAILPFVSTLIWQILVVATIVIFRKELARLLKNIGSIRFGDTEVKFQDPSEESETASEYEQPSPPLSYDREGFLTLKATEQLVSTSRFVEPGESVIEALLTYRTKRQHTWLVTTNRQLFIILDDEDTRTSQRLIQIKRDLSGLGKAETRSESDRSGIFKFASTNYWYYSKGQLGDEKVAATRLDRLIEEASSGDA